MQGRSSTPGRINPFVPRAEPLNSKLSFFQTGQRSLPSQGPERDPLLRETRPWHLHHGKGRLLRAPDSAGLRVSLGASPAATNPTSHNLCRSSCLPWCSSGLTVDGKLLEGGKRDRAAAVSLAAELDVGDQRFQVCHVLAVGQHVRLPGKDFDVSHWETPPSPMSSPLLHQTAVPHLPVSSCVSEVQERLLVSPGPESWQRPPRETKGGSGAQAYEDEGVCDTGWCHRGTPPHHPHAR